MPRLRPRGRAHRILCTGMMSQGGRGRISAPGNKSWLMPGPFLDHPAPNSCRALPARPWLGANSQLKGHFSALSHTSHQSHHITSITPGLCSFPAQPHPTALERLEPRQSWTRLCWEQGVLGSLVLSQGVLREPSSDKNLYQVCVGKFGMDLPLAWAEPWEYQN